MTYHHHPKPFLLLLVSIWLRVWCLLSSSSFLQSESSHPFKTDGTVIELDESNFDLAISTFDFILVDFYATWCGHCQRLSPELDVAAPVLAGLSPPMIIAKIDADKYRKLATKYEIDGFPTLKVFMHGVPIEYNGPRKADLLVRFLRKFVTPDVAILESDSAIHNFVKTSGTDFPIFIGFGLDESVIAEFAKKYKKKAWFSVAKDFSEDFMVTYDFDKVPALVSLHPSYNEQSVFYGPFEGHFLEEFIKQNQLPLSVPINYETLKLLSDDKRKIALTIMEDQLDEKSISLVKILKSAASANRDLVFSYVGVKQWKEFADTFEVNKGTKLPKMIIWDGNENYNIVEGSESLNDDEDHGSQISRILESYREGKVVQKRVGGPSFTGFINSLITINTVYLIIFVVAVLVLIQFMSRQGDIPQRSQARVSDTETSSSIHESERSEYRPEDKMD